MHLEIGENLKSFFIFMCVAIVILFAIYMTKSIWCLLGLFVVEFIYR
jgi:predicted RND superfamily exporter protein